MATKLIPINPQKIIKGGLWIALYTLLGYLVRIFCVVLLSNELRSKIRNLVLMSTNGVLFFKDLFSLALLETEVETMYYP